MFGTAVTSAAAINVANNFELNELVFPIVFVGSTMAMFGSAFALDFFKPKYGVKNQNNTGNEAGNEVVLINDPKRIAAITTLSVSTGVMLAPVLFMMNEINPTIIPASACLTTLTMAGMIHYAINTPRSLISYGPAIHIGLWGLIGNGILGMFLFPCQLSFLVDTFFGTALFMGITAYDTQCAIKAYQEKQPDHIYYAGNFYLNFINLFVRIMDALAKAKH